MTDNLTSALPSGPAARMQAELAFLYGDDRAPALFAELERRLLAFAPPPAPPGTRFSERDVILITYGDIVQRARETPLYTLHSILTRYLADVVNSVHILPFFPYSSDDGFSIIDYTTVDPRLGDWADVARLDADFRLMFDAVINHISAQSAWFEGFRKGEMPYTDYFIVVSPDTDLSQVVRPRALPLLTAFDTAQGRKYVWTTFSADQVDLNYANPDVLLAIVDVLLTYVARGAHLIRLDAIAYLWKEIGTSCIHLPQTHAVIRLIRAVLDAVAPWVMLITETNVPHEENISYFGDGSDEAQMVYNFSLPPLTMHALTSGDASTLSRWASTLAPPSEQTTFFNFTASHDGIGLRPVQGILDAADIMALVEQAKAHGGKVSYKTDADGSQSPYELNVTYFDALSDPEGTEPLDLQARRFLVSQAIALAMPGVPGIYFHSLFGSRNDTAGVVEQGHSRAINREKLQADDLISALSDPASLRAMVFEQYAALLRVRCAEPAFHPNTETRVLDVGAPVFGLQRDDVIALHNVSDAPFECEVALDRDGRGFTAMHDLVSGAIYTLSGACLHLTLPPYAVCWLKPGRPGVNT